MTDRLDLCLVGSDRNAGACATDPSTVRSQSTLLRDAEADLGRIARENPNFTASRDVEPSIAAGRPQVSHTT